MKISKTDLADLLVIELKIHHDARGFFIERYHKDLYKELGLDINFVQDNHSRSVANVIRGLHYQTNPSQGKLVGVIRGKILDVAVDLRPNSSSFGKYFSIELSDKNTKLMWIPAGFAHGFANIGDSDADVIYKVDNHYNPNGDHGIRFDDPDLNIDWRVKYQTRILNYQASEDYKL